MGMCVFVTWGTAQTGRTCLCLRCVSWDLCSLFLFQDGTPGTTGALYYRLSSLPAQSLQVSMYLRWRILSGIIPSWKSWVMVQRVFWFVYARITRRQHQWLFLQLVSAVAINCLGKYGQYEFYFSTVKVFTIVALSLSSNPDGISIMLTKFDYPSHHRYSDRQLALEDGEYYPTRVVVMYTSGIRPDSHKNEHWSQIFDVSWRFCTVQRYPRSDRKDPWHLVRFDAGDYRSLFYRTLEYF